jgi:hypothetical protein
VLIENATGAGANVAADRTVKGGPDGYTLLMASNAQIARKLEIAGGTVKNHISSIFEKLGVENRNAATVRSLEVLSRPTFGSRTVS